jgi:transcriptional regulator with XRE-family HTH domain
MDQVKIGKFIAALRKERGMTQVQLAEELGVTQKSVSRWETGKNMPDLSMLQVLASELNISVPELLDGKKADAEPKNIDEAIGQVIDYSAQMKRHSVFRLKDVNYITGVIIALSVVLLAVGSFENAQTIPLLIFSLVVIAFIFRSLFGRCPSCGKRLPFTVRTLKSCPHCGGQIYHV